MDKINIKEGLKKNVAEQAYKSNSYFGKFYQKGNSNINKYDDGANYLNKKEVHQDLSMDKINIEEGLKKNLVEQAAETNSDFKKELLKVFIYIYFYEKIVTEDNNFFINSKEKYYLINPGWLNKFKEVYSYTQIKKNIESIKISLNYNEIDSMIETIIKFLSTKTTINTVALDEDLKVLNTINTSVQRKNNVLFTNEGVILPSKIMNIFKNWDEKFKQYIQPKTFIFEIDYIYYINRNNIIVSKTSKSATFSPKYCFAYKSPILEKEEEKKLIETSINEYIIQKNCKNEVGVYKLLNEADQQPIGLLIILEDMEKNDNNKVPKRNEQIINNKKKPNLISDNINKYKEMKKTISKKEKELVNDNNQLNDLKQEIHSKKEQNENIINKEFDKINQEPKKGFLLGNKKTENYLVTKELGNNQIIKNEANLISISKKKKQINKINDYLKEQKNKQKDKFQKLYETNLALKEKIKNLTQSNEKLVERIKDYEKQETMEKNLINENNNLNIKINNLEQNLQKKIGENENINQKLVKLEKEKSKLIQQNNNMNGKLKRIEFEMKQMKQKEQNLIAFQQLNVEKQKIIKDLEEKEKYLIEQNDNLIEKNKNLEKEILKLNTEKDNLFQEKEKYKGEISEYQTKKEKDDIINEKNINLNNQIIDLQKNLEKKKEDIENIKQEFEKLKKEKEQLAKINNDMNVKLKIDEQEMKKMKQKEMDLIYSQKNNLENKEKIKELEKSESNLNEQNRQLVQKNANLEEQISKLKEEKNNLSKEIEIYKEEALKNKTQKDNLINEKNINLNKQIKILEEDLGKKGNQIININKELAELKNQNKLLNQQNNDLKNDLNDKLKKKELEINQMKEINLASSQKMNNDNKKIINELQENEKNLKIKNEQLSQKNAEFQKQITNLSKSNDNLLKKMKQYEEDISKSQAEKKDLINYKEKIDLLEKEKNSLQNENKQKDNKIKEIQLELTQQKNNELNTRLMRNKEIEINKRLKDLEEKEKNIDILVKKSKDLTENNKNIERNISNLKKEEEELIKKLKQYDEQILAKKKTLDEIKESPKKNTQIQKEKNEKKEKNSLSKSLQNPIKEQNKIENKNEILENNINQPLQQAFRQRPNMGFVGNMTQIPQQNTFNNSPMVNNFMPNTNMGFQYQQNPSMQPKPPIKTTEQINPKPPITEPYIPPKPSGPISLYKKPTLIGLNNLGSTCYKNAVLQCLSQTEGLTNYFLKEANRSKIFDNNYAKTNKNELQFCPIYYDLIQNLWKKNASFKSFSPETFMNGISEMTKNDQVTFSLYEAGDAKDFIIYILERMHKELKKPVGDNKQLGQNTPEQELNQYDKMNTLNYFMNEFKKETSIISDLFYGFNETTNVCQYCKQYYNSRGQNEPICYNYGIFNVLIFPLDEVRKYREQMMKLNNVHINMGNLSNIVNINECFFYNQKSEYFTGQNQNWCNICNQQYDSLYTSKIFVSPNVLIIILNRGKGNIYKIKIDFTEQIDISNFVLAKQKEIYNLYGVITHLGESGPNAHFVAACKSPVDGKWYRYNDAFVNPINNFKKDIYDFGTPYILFYQKQK